MLERTNTKKMTQAVRKELHVSEHIFAPDRSRHMWGPVLQHVGCQVCPCGALRDCRTKEVTVSLEYLLLQRKSRRSREDTQ
jgi:hypothetical protein